MADSEVTEVAEVTDIRVRPAEPGELEQLGELTYAAYADDCLLDHEPYGDELRAAARRAEHAELLAAVDADGRLLGTVTVVLPGTPYAELAREGELEFRMLAVARHARGRGVGAALTRAVLDRARALGAARVVLCSMRTMRAAHRLYERLGFARVPERDWTPVPGITLIAFARDL
ncbi:GNAT family N-acetyltransferase [Prauserella muralis]|uniref:Acetyltransferase n=1 Tax=Prauserella muralis TaxID=588067 RepID=A0A2V4AYQ0_9PSEU|nr:GNAT family N-acetyltransferase [Prauserella muralis]PXY27024.1 acetyltransferase [Prauserella muralis]TWE23354.1 acetyltransferase (GNAT) family protein [Prauserella muralis]